MKLKQIIHKDCCVVSELKTKKRVLELISILAQHHVPDMNHKVIFDDLLKRERLGSTVLGNGMAIPHARIKELTIPIGVFISLKNEIEFDPSESQQIDLLFALLTPSSEADEHLNLLAQIASLFQKQGVRATLKKATTDSALYAALLTQLD